MSPSSKKFFDFVSKHTTGFTITTHLHPDVDGVCSAFLLKLLFPKSKVVFSSKLSHAAKVVCEKYNIVYEEQSTLNASTTVLVDVDDVALVPEHSGKFLGVIDHHSVSGRIKCSVRVRDSKAPSTTYVIYNMMKERRIRPTPMQAELVLLGIIADTYRFKSVNYTTVFEDVAQLLKISRKSYDELLALIESNELSLSEKLVYARSFRDYRIFREKENEYIFILSGCEGFQSLIATKIVECMGVDFALTYAESEGEMKIVARSSSRLNLHLGAFMSELGKKLGGSGGGHKHAAGATIPVMDSKRVEEEAIKLLGKIYSLVEE